MEKRKCSVCGYLYDPNIGISEDGVVPGTLFEQLPENWVCPVCSAPKTVFEKE
ncbi:MAG: rubredoxin [Endomicrobium sp.]|nr:rubredoxin [Endomicrobium sp.]